MREFDSQMASLNKSYTYVLLRANHLNKYTTPKATFFFQAFPHTTHYIREQSYLKGFIYIYYLYILLHSSLEYIILISRLRFCGQIFIKLLL